MLKITIEVKENKNKDSCTVKMINPKDLSKASNQEGALKNMPHIENTVDLQSIANQPFFRMYDNYLP